jgi:hypothetical protein
VIRSKYLFFFTAAAVVLAGCQNAANTTNNTNSNANAVVVTTTTNSAPAGNNATANDPGNPAGSPTDVYKAAYTARKNCDIPGLKKVMSKELLDFLAKMGKDDKKSLDDELKELCSRPQGSTESVRNEKIDGDHASIEYMDEENKWQRMDFIREDGAWKMSLGGGPGEDAPDKDDKEDNRS